MVQFLKKLWKALKQSSPDKAETVFVSPDEWIARFVYDKSAWSKQPTPKPKPKVFFPEMYKGQWETSVCRISAAPEQRIWEIAHRARSPRPALARADLTVNSVEAVGLRTNPAPNLDADYPEHAIIVGWPDEKDKQMELAIQLVTSTNLVFAPDQK